MRNGFVFYYFFVAWGFIIFILLLIAISHRRPGSGQTDESEPEV
jgi:hypothetical protein